MLKYISCMFSLHFVSLQINEHDDDDDDVCIQPTS